MTLLAISLAAGMLGGFHLGALLSTHTLDHLLNQFGYGAVFALVMVESLGVNIGYAIGYWGGYRLLRRYVFFGRFVSILRTYAAFLAGVNRMKWHRFLLFNAAGGVLWGGIYSFAFYYAGNTFKRLRGTVDVALGAAAAVLIIA